MNIKNDDFERYVAEAIDEIPTHYQERMKHVAILVEDLPTDQQRKALGLRECDALFGLYEGVPLPQRGGRVLQIQPDVITIFRYPMTGLYADPEELKKQVFKTLWHEVAHYFGLNHDDIDAISERSNKRRSGEKH